MTKWYTSDTHAFHKKVVGFTNRGVETTQEDHELWLKKLWNSQVKSGDIVYLLGDVSFGRFDNTCEWLLGLNGQKIIIKGNHDRKDDLNHLVNGNIIQAWYEYKEIKIGDTTACLFHFPIASWHKQHHGSLCLHGHSHGSFEGQGKILDVGIDNSYNVFGKHCLFSEDDVLQYMQGREVYIAESHRSYKER